MLQPSNTLKMCSPDNIGSNPEKPLSGFPDLPPLVVVLGPTAVGKTEMAINVANHVGGEIVSADSRLFYRGMDIGTAKPTLSQRAQVPHYLIDVTTPDQPWNLAQYQEEARRIIAAILERGRLPLLVGGTGQYIRAVIEEWDIPRIQPDLRLRCILEKWAGEIGPEGLHARLAKLDPAAAEVIEARNMRRTIRALEVIFLSGKRFSEQRKRLPARYDTLLIGLTLTRQELYTRIDARIQNMLEAGFIDEVRGLVEMGYSPDLPSMAAIGYKEIITYLQGKTSLEEAVMLIRRNTRTFVRRQANWFKENDPQIHWFPSRQSSEEEVMKLINKWLSTRDKFPKNDY